MAISDLLLNILSRSDKRGLTEAADELDKLGRKADTAGEKLKGTTKESGQLDEQITKTKAKIKELGEEFDKTGSKELLPQIRRERGSLAALQRIKQDLADAGDAATQAGGKIQGVDARLREARNTVRQLAEEFARTRDVDVFAKLRNAGKDVAGLEKFVKTVEHLASDAETAGREAGKTFTSGLQGSLSTPVLGPALIAGLVGAAIVAAPAIGAAVASGVTLGVGGGALAAGIVLAAKDQRVKSAWGDFGKSAKDELTSAAGVFVQPLVNSTRIFRGAFAEIMPGIRGDFAGLAPLVERLSSGVAGFVTNAMPGVNRLVDVAGPFIGELANELPNIGNAMSDFFSSLSAGGPGAKQFFHDLLVFTEKTIVAVGNMVEFLSKGYALVSGIAAGMHGDVTGALRIMDQFGDNGPKNLHDFRDAASHAAEAVSRVLNPSMEDFGKAADRSLASVEDLAKSNWATKIFDSMMSIDQATLGFAESQTRLSQAIDDNGRHLDIHTARGQANREAILGAVQANMAQYQANIAVGMSAADAALAYDTNTTALENQLRAAHFTQAEIDGLIGKYRGVPAQVNTEIAMHGLADAISSLDDAIRRANGLDGRVVNTTIKTTYIDDRSSSINQLREIRGANRWGGITEHAETGLLRDATVFSAVGSGARYAFAEPATGGEAFVPKHGDYGRSMGILSQAASWYDAAVVPRSSGDAAPAMAASGRDGGSAVVHNTFNIYDATDPDRVVAAIATYERNNGSGWRS